MTLTFCAPTSSLHPYFKPSQRAFLKDAALSDSPPVNLGSSLSMPPEEQSQNLKEMCFKLNAIVSEPGIPFSDDVSRDPVQLIAGESRHQHNVTFL